MIRSIQPTTKQNIPNHLSHALSRLRLSGHNLNVEQLQLVNNNSTEFLTSLESALYATGTAKTKIMYLRLPNCTLDRIVHLKVLLEQSAVQEYCSNNCIAAGLLFRTL